VQDVIKDSPADKAGIEQGDVIIEIDGEEINSTNELQSIIIKHRVGDKINLKIWRNGKEIEKTATLAPRLESGEMALSKSDNNKDINPKDAKPMKLDKIGIEVKPLTPELKEKFEVNNGVLVSSVDPNSPILKRGIMPNTVIIAADQQDINTPSDLKKIIESKKPGDAILLKVKSQNSTRLVAIEIPKS
ncbi:MAG TPA: PDZ domain-containing protein, partial [Candidatus Kapabacteria bacterium]|nr:PDZ domain-containing protein [Candidatus Kapabacteria bacterium]